MSEAPQKRAYDVIVVGAGIVGLACAWRLAQDGLDVVVLERDLPGDGASGVAAGMLAPVTEAEFGEERLLELNLEGRSLWCGFAEELEEAAGESCGYRDSGALVVAVDRDDVGELRRLHDFQRSLELDAEWLSGSECRRVEPGLSPRVSGAIHTPEDGHADPRAVTAALCAALRRAGGELVSGAGVVAVEADGQHVVGVRTDGGASLAADTVVVSAGAWTGGLSLPPEVRPPAVRPLKGQILRLRGRAGTPLADRLVRSPRCYVVPRADGRVVVGATMEERGFDTTVTVDGVFRLLEAARELLPEVGELALVESSAGLRPATPHNLPVIGPDPFDGLVWACGHNRNGVLLAPLTADAVRASISGADEPPSSARYCLPGRSAAPAGVSS